MYHQMRRKDRAMAPESARIIIENGEYGILATVGADGRPYATPLSYVVNDDCIYIHCAKTGQKVDNIIYQPHVCFSVVGNTQPVYDGSFSTYYESVIVHGKAVEVVDASEKQQILLQLAQKYLPQHMDKTADINAHVANTFVFKIAIGHMTGKAKVKK